VSHPSVGGETYLRAVFCNDRKFFALSAKLCAAQGSFFDLPSRVVDFNTNTRINNCCAAKNIIPRHWAYSCFLAGELI
jgi:hypothetical protein